MQRHFFFRSLTRSSLPLLIHTDHLPPKPPEPKAGDEVAPNPPLTGLCCALPPKLLPPKAFEAPPMEDPKPEVPPPPKGFAFVVAGDPKAFCCCWPKGDTPAPPVPKPPPNDIPLGSGQSRGNPPSLFLFLGRLANFLLAPPGARFRGAIRNGRNGKR